MGDLPDGPDREADPDVGPARSAEDLQRVDYEQTVQIVRMLTDVRFKLLALVPTVSAIGVVVAEGRSRADAIGLALVGLSATVGILVYDLRNSQLYGAAVHRAKVVEERIGLRRSNPAESDVPGGLFSERPYRLRLAGVAIWHDRGLALVYAAATTGWLYVLSAAVLPAAGEGFASAALNEDTEQDASPWALGVAIAGGLLMCWLIHVFDYRGDRRKRRVAWLIRSAERPEVPHHEVLEHANRPRLATASPMSRSDDAASTLRTDGARRGECADSADAELRDKQAPGP
ncbi:hypothetical protein ACI784_09110 [Geodermatophilus sp. SYSU D01186]